MFVATADVAFWISVNVEKVCPIDEKWWKRWIKWIQNQISCRTKNFPRFNNVMMSKCLDEIEQNNSNNSDYLLWVWRSECINWFSISIRFVSFTKKKFSIRCKLEWIWRRQDGLHCKNVTPDTGMHKHNGQIDWWNALKFGKPKNIFRFWRLQKLHKVNQVLVICHLHAHTTGILATCTNGICKIYFWYEKSIFPKCQVFKLRIKSKMQLFIHWGFDSRNNKSGKKIGEIGQQPKCDLKYDAIPCSISTRHANVPLHSTTIHGFFFFLSMPHFNNNM